MEVAGHNFDYGDNFVNSHPKCTISEYVQVFCKWYRKVQMNKQVYVNLWTINKIWTKG
jgi:uncharacterized protein YodC (DUF2158 family)